MNLTKQYTIIRRLSTWTMLFMVAVCLFVNVSYADDKMPADLYAMIMLKVLNYDRNLKPLEGEIVVGVLYREKSVEEKGYAQDLFAALDILSKSVKVKNYPFKAVLLAVDDFSLIDPEHLRGKLLEQSLAALVVVPADCDAFVKLTAIVRELHVNSFSTHEKCLEHGLAVSIILQNDRPRIVVNVASVKAEGSDYSAHLLKLCKLIKADARQ